MDTKGYIRYAILQLLILISICYYLVCYIILLAYYSIKGKRLSRTRKRDQEPTSLNDPTIGEHGYLDLKKRDGLKIHYVANGSRSKPLMLFIHGFPEFWYMWKNQLKEFGADYYAVAIDLPGYGNSSIPGDRRRYSMQEISADVKEFILELGYSSCVLVGHDWGAVVAFHTAIEHPDVVDKLINMNVPHKKAFEENRSLNQLWKSSYILFFQVPYLSEYMLSSMDHISLNYIFQVHTNSDYFTDDEVDVYKYTFTKSGWTGPLNYYRNVLTPSAEGKGNVVMPSLLLWGTDDVALSVNLAAASAKFLENGSVVYLDGASHFVNTDAPDMVHKHMREFLAR